MKNIFVIHALGNTGKNYWYPFIKKGAKKRGIRCFTPTLPPINKMSYESWSKKFDKYRKYINEESIFVGHSTGSIFVVKYLMENNLKIDTYISVVGFNEAMEQTSHPDWDEINKSFFVKDLKRFKHYAKRRVSFYSPTDIYDFKLLDDFATKIDAEKVIIDKAGHFTAATGYGEKLDEIIPYLFN